MSIATKKWLKAGLAHIITGVSSAVLSSAGTAVTGSALTWKQFVTIVITTGFVGAAAYLKQSPVPPDDDNTK